jgi:hypothetical protein
MEPSMGLMMDLRSGRRSTWCGAGNFIFWVLAGGGAGSAIVLVDPQITDAGRFFFTLLGGCIGAAIGFYATFGESTLARILEVPGQILGVILLFVRLPG